MGERKGRLRRSISSWANPAEEHARDLAATVERTGCTKIAQVHDRERVQLQGTLRTVTLRPRGGVPALEAELFDGTDIVTLVWLGRRRIAGIAAGRTLRVEGRVGKQGDACVMFNPRYELKS